MACLESKAKSIVNQLEEAAKHLNGLGTNFGSSGIVTVDSPSGLPLAKGEMARQTSGNRVRNGSGGNIGETPHSRVTSMDKRETDCLGFRRASIVLAGPFPTLGADLGMTVKAA